jgi:DNA-binding NtrC family response regulator
MGKVIKIAIIDDEPSILEMIETYLHRASGFNVSTFSNPQSAIGSIDASYDVVLLDMMMPSLSGLDVLKVLREKVPELVIVMMTAYSTLDKVLKSHREGATHYIMKPFSSMKALEEKILELVHK